MNLSDIRPRIEEMDAALIEKGYIRPNCELQIEGGADYTIWVRTSPQDEIPGKHEYVECETIEAVLDAADDLIENFPSAHHHKKKEAVKQFGRAVDGLRSAGFEAEFTDPLSEQLQAMTENLLTDQRAAQ